MSVKTLVEYWTIIAHLKLNIEDGDLGVYVIHVRIFGARVHFT